MSKSPNNNFSIGGAGYDPERRIPPKGFGSAVVAPDAFPLQYPGFIAPEPKPKHDGFLDEEKQFKAEFVEGGVSLVMLSTPIESMHLYASEALSLLAWLLQEREKLEQLLKEQEA